MKSSSDQRVLRSGGLAKAKVSAAACHRLLNIPFLSLVIRVSKIVGEIIKAYMIRKASAMCITGASHWRNISFSNGNKPGTSCIT